MPPPEPPFRREKYSVWNWSKRSLVAQLGGVLDEAADFVPLPEVISSQAIAALKASLVGAGQLFPEQPFVSQLDFVPDEVGAVTDIVELLWREGVGRAQQAITPALFELGLLDRGTRSSLATWVMPVWLNDP